MRSPRMLILWLATLSILVETAGLAKAEQAVDSPAPIEQSVAWPPKSALREDVWSGLAAEQRSKVALSPIPVLLPGSAEQAGRAVISTGPHWYAASVSEEGYSLVINATRLSYKIQREAWRAGSKARGLPAVVSESEGIWSVSWQEFGVSYMLRMGCEPESRLCDDDRHVRQLAESLVYVGGAQ